MQIDETILKEERATLKTDFDTLTGRIAQVEKDLGTMKGNLNAVFGAIQQVDKLLVKVQPKKDEKVLLNEKEKGMPADKQQALNLATS
jgi:seryl-tRNA synthetase|tara:strand:- start:381 stop:644 length:264 start_codon:yes stop_codon:yes gene_type:complete